MCEAFSIFIVKLFVYFFLDFVVKTDRSYHKFSFESSMVEMWHIHLQKTESKKVVKIPKILKLFEINWDLVYVNSQGVFLNMWLRLSSRVTIPSKFSFCKKEKKQKKIDTTSKRFTYPYSVHWQLSDKLTLTQERFIPFCSSSLASRFSKVPLLEWSLSRTKKLNNKLIVNVIPKF